MKSRAAIGGLALSAILGAIAQPEALAAHLRPYVTISGSTVRLSDLFSDLDRGQDCILGPGPSPGARIVVGEAQLTAIADEFGVSWNAGRGAQSAILSRPGEILTRATVIDALRASLIPLGLAPDSDIAVSGWTDQMVDPSDHLSVKDPLFDPVSGRFSALLSLADRSHEPTEIALDGTASELTKILVVTRPIMTGQVLGEADFSVAKRPQDHLYADTLRSVADAVGLTSTRPLSPGEPIARSWLRAPSLVFHGSVVMLQLSAGGLTLSAGGIALDTGASGDRVRVVNTSSKALLMGTVSDRGTVTINPDSTPMIVDNEPDHTSLPPGFPLQASFAYGGLEP